MRQGVPKQYFVKYLCIRAEGKKMLVVIIIIFVLSSPIHLVSITNYSLLLVPSDQKRNETGNSSKHFHTVTTEWNFGYFTQRVSFLYYYDDLEHFLFSKFTVHAHVVLHQVNELLHILCLHKLVVDVNQECLVK